MKRNSRNMFIIETSETGGEWSARFSNDLELKRVWYNGFDVTDKVFKRRGWEDTVWAFFNERQDLDYALFCHMNPDCCD